MVWRGQGSSQAHRHRAHAQMRIRCIQEQRGKYLDLDPQIDRVQNVLNKMNSGAACRHSSFFMVKLGRSARRLALNDGAGQSE